MKSLLIPVMMFAYNPDVSGFPKWQSTQPVECSMSMSGVNLTQLQELNNQVNMAITYEKDTTDYWQKPEETLDRKAGDCEDFAILKQAMLRWNFKHEASELVVVRGKLSQEVHAVTRVFLDTGESVVLDFGSVMTEEQFEKRYFTHFAVNQCGWRIP